MFFFWKRWNCKRWKTTHTYTDFHEKLVDFEWHRTKPIENIIWNSQVEISRTRQSSPIYMHCNHRHKHHMVHIVQLLLQSSLHLKECWEGATATATECDDAIERKKNVCIIPQPCHQMNWRWLKATKSVKAAAFSNHFFSIVCVRCFSSGSILHVKILNIVCFKWKNCAKSEQHAQLMTCFLKGKKLHAHHTSYKHVTIFISLLDVFSSHHDNEMLQFELHSTFHNCEVVSIVCLFFVSLRRYVSIGENKPETKNELNNFHTQMWHKYVKLSVREEKTKTIPTAKTKRKIDGFECCSRIRCRSLFCVFVTIHVIVRIRLSFFLTHFATAAYCFFLFKHPMYVCEWVPVCVCVYVCRWRDDIPMLLLP